MNVLLDTPKHDDLIYDVGMHKGEDTDFYLRKGFRVVAFEADPELAGHCRERFQDYIRRGRLTVVEGAIVSPDSMAAGNKVRFYRNRELSVWGTVEAGWAERNARLGTSSSVTEVEAIDFVSALRQHGIPHYMKIDIEGLDIVCVTALGRFRERPDYISMESDKTSLAKIRREIETLAGLGYDSFQAVEQSKIPHSQPPPNLAREGNYVAQQFEPDSSGLFGAELAGEWMSKDAILRRYAFIRLGYYLVGDDGVLNRLRFRGAWRLRSMTVNLLKRLTREAVPGWYDTHARHSSVGAG
ncbi:MAG TPA: FkbM family methyltransferase [Pyrinomonadaceae bacterium]|jgi:FkbM family methyltransferase